MKPYEVEDMSINIVSPTMTLDQASKAHHVEREEGSPNQIMGSLEQLWADGKKELKKADGEPPNDAYALTKQAREVRILRDL